VIERPRHFIREPLSSAGKFDAVGQPQIACFNVKPILAVAFIRRRFGPLGTVRRAL
jgi:hypothetical protein